MQYGDIYLGSSRIILGLAEGTCGAFLKPVLPLRDLVRMHIKLLSLRSSLMCIRFFHSVIWFGCTSNCCASSARVLSPLRAAKATFDLNAAVWFRRGRLLICSPLFAILGGWGTEPPLSPLSEFPEPAQSVQTADHRLRVTEEA